MEGVAVAMGSEAGGWTCAAVMGWEERATPVCGPMSPSCSCGEE